MSEVGWRRGSVPKKCSSPPRSVRQGKSMKERSSVQDYFDTAGTLEIAPPGSAAAAVTTSKERGWIESPGYDLALLSLSPAAGLLFALVNQTTHFGYLA